MVFRRTLQQSYDLPAVGQYIGGRFTGSGR